MWLPSTALKQQPKSIPPPLLLDTLQAMLLPQSLPLPQSLQSQLPDTELLLTTSASVKLMLMPMPKLIPDMAILLTQLPSAKPPLRGSVTKSQFRLPAISPDRCALPCPVPLAPPSRCQWPGRFATQSHMKCAIQLRRRFLVKSVLPPIQPLPCMWLPWHMLLLDMGMLQLPMQAIMAIMLAIVRCLSSHLFSFDEFTCALQNFICIVLG